jgi:CDP-glycerol glycerophosphotransferase (TagB/SpsB family)
MKDIERVKFLFKKYNPSYILTFSEDSSFELIIIKIAQKFNIKIGFLQHALTTDDLDNSNNYIIKWDNFCRILPVYSDHFLVWDKLTQEHAIKHNVDPKKIIPMGCPFFDTFFQDDKNPVNSKNEYILLAIAPFSGMYTRQLSTQMQIEFENTIKQICQITTKMNKKLLIKIHSGPSFNEKIVKNINPNIVVKYTGSFHDYVKNCELLICIDMSTAILDAMLLKKPVISILILEKDSDSELSRKNYILQTEMPHLEKTLTKLSLDNSFKLSCIEQGQKFIDKYMINTGTSSKSLLNFLSNISGKTTN